MNDVNAVSSLEPVRPRPSLWVRWIKGMWNFVDVSRRVALNVLFLILVAIFIAASLSGGAVAPLAEKTTLVLDMPGHIQEQASMDPQEAAVSELMGNEVSQQMSLRDILRVLDEAAADPKITQALLLLDDLESVGLTQSRDLAAAMMRFRAQNKKIYAWAGRYSQRQYYLAAHADEVWMHPMGAVSLEGFGRLRAYYKDALDRLGVDVHLVKAGTFKSFAEPYIANGPSPAAREADTLLLEGLWSTYQTGVEKARKLAPGALQSYIDEAPDALTKLNGDTGQLALQSKLIDALKTRDEVRAFLIEKGAEDEAKSSFRQVALGDYLHHHLSAPAVPTEGVGLIVAQGNIEDGSSGPNVIGGLETASLIRKARENDKIKSLLIRVNSPGGSAYGSELIRREVELTRAAGKPVVVSMGDVAASGGYWLSMGADEVMADEATVTGSIGVFTILPGVDKVMDKLGIHADGVTTTWMGAAGDPRKPADPRFIQMVQASVDHIYAQFTERAAQSRKTTQSAIDAVAQGRVWTGKQALERGLVDALGGWNDAVRRAGVLGKLGETPALMHMEREVGRVEQLLSWFGATSGQAMTQWLNQRASWLAMQWGGAAAAGLEPLWRAGLSTPAAADGLQDLKWVLKHSQSRGAQIGGPQAVTHCLCQAP